jgi:predicted metalloendopeptidase
MTAPIANAFYDPQQNLIAITPGIAQFPNYSDDVSEYVTCARLGFTIGHELTHGFDNNGRHFDKYGAQHE